MHAELSVYHPEHHTSHDFGGEETITYQNQKSLLLSLNTDKHGVK